MGKKQPNIRWREKDKKELTLWVRRFNKKLKEVKANTKDTKLKYLPDKMSSKDIKKRITTRNDFKREINSLKSFLEEGSEELIHAESGNTVTRWHYNRMKTFTDIITDKRRAEKKQYANRKDLANNTIAQSENLKDKEFNFDKIRGGKEWEKFVKSVETQVMDSYYADKQERYKNNYLDAIKQNIGDEYGKELYKFIESVPAEDLYLIYWEDDAVLKIQFTSDPLPVKKIARNTLEHWYKRLPQYAPKGYKAGDDVFSYSSPDNTEG